VIYSSDLFTYNAKYFQILPREKWQSFANSLRSMLKLVDEVGWQFAKKLVHEVVWQAPAKSPVVCFRGGERGTCLRPPCGVTHV